MHHVRRMQPQAATTPRLSQRAAQRWQLKPLARAIAAASLLSSPLWLQAAQPASNALPTGLQVSAGQASVLTQGNQMTVRNSNGAILNWSSFNIGSAAGVTFDQANAASKVLNRVTGQDPTQIFGSLASNGQVWLLNPSGVLFGQGARVDVASLVTSTLRLNDNDFLSNRYQFIGDTGSTATVRNEGTIRSAHGGQVVLLGAKVDNTGSVEAPGGNVTLAAARSVELVDTGLPNLAVRVDVAEGETLNMGRLVADGGTVDVFGVIVNQQGLVQADTLAVDAYGRVTLKASDTLMLGTGSVTQARGLAAGSAGGSVDLLGRNVGLAGTASVDVSGAAAGGGIRVGGGQQGRDSTVPNAQAVWFGPDAVLRADATGDTGTGGRILLWSDATTRAYGTLSTRGGRLGGAGGFVETSGRWLDARPALVDVSSRSGLAGRWLLDPNDISIQDTGSDAHISGGPNFTTTNDSAIVTTGTIAAALNSGANVTISTGAAGSNAEAGDIVMGNATLNVSPAQPVTLTLQATRDVLIYGSTLSTSGSALSLDLVSAGGGHGTVNVINSSITTRGGNLSLRGANPVSLATPTGSTTTTYNAAIAYSPGASEPAPKGTSAVASLYSASMSNADIPTLLYNTAVDLGAGTLSMTGAGGAFTFGAWLESTGRPVTAGQLNLVGSGNGQGVLIAGTPLTLSAGMDILGYGTDASFGAGFVLGTGTSISVNAAANSGALVTIQGDGGNRGVELYSDGTIAGSAHLAVVNARPQILGVGTAGPGVGMYLFTGGAEPLLDLSASVNPVISGDTRNGTIGIEANNIYIKLPGNSGLPLSANKGLSINNTVMDSGGGSITLSGQSVTLTNSNILAGPSTLAVNVVSAGPQSDGVTLLNSIINTNGADVSLGALMTLNSSVLGSTSVPANWIDYTGSSNRAAVQINGSTIDAGLGRIVGGGANRGAAGGLGLEIVQSNLNARQIILAGRSDSEAGLVVDGSTLLADRVLKLDGLSAGTQLSNGPGLYVAPGSTLQVSDAGSNAGSQLALNGKNISGQVGVLLEGGDAGTANETRVIVSGAALDIRGDGPVSGGLGVAMTGTAAAPGGMLINALGATSATIDGSSSTATGGGLSLQYVNVLGPQATSGAPMLLKGSGRQADGTPSTLIDSSTITTGGTLTVQGDGMAITASDLTGEAGLALLSNTGAGAPASGPVYVFETALIATAAGATLRIEGTAGDAVRGDVAYQSGAGVTLNNSALASSGAGGHISVQGQGAGTGGNGITFVQTPFTADNLIMTGTGVLDGHGIWSENFGGGQLSTLTAINLTLNGQSANNPSAPDKAGVRLSNGANIVLSGRGTASINGDSAALGGTAVGQPFTAAGDAANFIVNTTGSMQLRNATLDFTSGSGTAITLNGDSDHSGGGRVRVQASQLLSGGGDINLSGVGVRNGVAGFPTQNSSLLDGSVGVFLINSTLNMGSGTANITGSGPADGLAQAQGAGGNAGVTVSGANSIAGGAIRISGDGGDYSRGFDVGVSQAGASLTLQANDISITGRGTGIDPATSLPYAGVQVNSTATSNWTVLNPGTGLNTAPLVVTSTAGPMELTGVNASTGRFTATAPAALTLEGSNITAADSITVTAIGAPMVGNTVLLGNGNYTAGGAVNVTGTATSTGVGVSLQQGTVLSGGSVNIRGTGVGTVGVLLVDNTGSDTVSATSGPLSITGRSDSTQGVAIAGGWTLSSPGTIGIDSNDGLLLIGNTGVAQAFNAGQALNLDFLAPTGLTVGQGQALDSLLLGTAVAGMSASSTVRVSASAGLTTTGAFSVPGRLVLQADSMTLQSTTTLSGNAAGDAVVLRGAGGGFITNFTNNAGSAPLSTPNGRWVLLSADPRQDALGGLQGGFSAYGLAAQPWATDAQGNYVTPGAGNALGYGISTAALNGQGLTGLLTKVYDASPSVTLNPVTWTLTGLNSGDTLSFTGSNTGTLANKNVGNGLAVNTSATTFSVLDASGRPVFGYGTPSFTANVTPLSVSLTGTTVANKVYDGNPAGSFSSLGSVTPLAGDSLAVGGSATAIFSDKNVGTGKSVAVGGFALTGSDAANYTLVAPATLSADITARALAITGLTAQSRVYDTTTTATLAGTAGIAPVAGDLVALGGTPAASFADKNVGTGKAVTVTGYALSGADAGNYTLAQPAGLSANITAAAVNLNGLTAQAKVYDATTNASFLGTASVTPLAGDTLTLAGTAQGRFGDKNVGTGKPVTLSGLSLAGADAANYTLVVPGFTANIAPAALGLLNVAAASKTYDSTRTAGMSGTLTGALPGDAVNLNLTGQFSDANVGIAKTVTWAAATTGADAGNYTLAPALGALQATITPATLLYVASPVLGTVGQAIPVLTGNLSGFAGSDTLASATTGTLVWTTPATLASAVGLYAVTGGGLAAPNYVFAQAPGNRTALTLQSPTAADAGTTSTNVVTTAALISVQLPVTMSTPTQGRVLDVTTEFTPAGSAGDGMAFRASASSRADTGSGNASSSPGAPTVPLTVEQGIAIALQSAGEAASGTAFRALDLSRLPREEVQSLLAARARYKQQVFSKGVYRLQQDPTLADVRACRSEGELETGTCIVTEQLKQEIQLARAKLAPMSAPRAERARRGVKAAALPVIQRKLALVIGINQYRDVHIPELAGSIPDARAVRQILDTRMGYETTVLENANREQIVRAFNKLALEAEANDSVIVYYAGHGVLMPVDGVDTGYWLPSDVNAEAPDTWLSNADIARLLAAVGAKQVMLVSDSCYSGQLVGKDRVLLSNAKDASDMLKRRAAVVMSSGGDEPVADQGRDGHSVFAWHFMRALESLDQWQVGGSLYERIRAGVVKDFPQTPQYGANRAGGHQGNTDYLFERRELEALKP